MSLVHVASYILLAMDSGQSLQLHCLVTTVYSRAVVSQTVKPQLKLVS